MKLKYDFVMKITLSLISVTMIVGCSFHEPVTQPPPSNVNEQNNILEKLKTQNEELSNMRESEIRTIINNQDQILSRQNNLSSSQENIESILSNNFIHYVWGCFCSCGSNRNSLVPSSMLRHCLGADCEGCEHRECSKDDDNNTYAFRDCDNRFGPNKLPQH